MSTVACKRIDFKTENPEDIFSAVRETMELIAWKKYVKKGTLILKINAVWNRLYPGCTTTPMVIEGVIKTLLASKLFSPKDIIIADTDTAAMKKADQSFRIQGITRLAEKYHIKLVNLTHTEFAVMPFKGRVLSNLKISKVLLNADNIITLPVLKTHAYSQITGGLKNQWGCIHDLRHNYHLVLPQAISDVNKFFKDKMCFGLTDCLFGMEGQGPKNGHPLQIGYLLASHDLVSLDSAAATVMGFGSQTIKHIAFAEKMGLGSTKFSAVGDKLPIYNFKPAANSNVVMKWEMRFRRLNPLMEKLMFHEKSPFLVLLTTMASIYYDLWYKVAGERYTREMIATNFGKIWAKRYLSGNKN